MGLSTKYTSGRRRWVRALWLMTAAAIVAAVTVVRHNWDKLYWELQYNVPVRFDLPFKRISAQVDRIVVVDSRYRWNTFNPGNGTVLFQVTNPAKAREAASHLQFQPLTTKDSAGDSYGASAAWPTICWYSGGKKIAVTGVLDYDTIRWTGFSTRRFFGRPTYFGDAPLTSESQKWLKQWLVSHGVPLVPLDVFPGPGGLKSPRQNSSTD